MKGIELNTFVKDCLLFGKREWFFIRLGIATWICICGMIATPIVITILILKQ
jgi:hypothetical protein